MVTILEKVSKLLTMATRGEGEEARTAALIAARLIVENNLLAPVYEPPRTAVELKDVVDELLRAFLALAWEARKDKERLVTVPGVVDAAIGEGMLRRSEREKVLNLLGSRVIEERKRGVLVSVRGRNGGYRMAHGVTRSHARSG